MESLLNNINATVLSMNEAFDNGDYRQLSLLAHRMLPNIRNLGASVESDLLKQIETSGRLDSPDTETIKVLLEKATDGMHLIAKALKDELLNY
jgi:hypothetical protein